MARLARVRTGRRQRVRPSRHVTAPPDLLIDRPTDAAQAAVTPSHCTGAGSSHTGPSHLTAVTPGLTGQHRLSDELCLTMQLRPTLGPLQGPEVSRGWADGTGSACTAPDQADRTPGIPTYIPPGCTLAFNEALIWKTNVRRLLFWASQHAVITF